MNEHPERCSVPRCGAEMTKPEIGDFFFQFVSAGIDDFGRLIVRPRFALPLEKKVRIAQSGD